MFKSDYMLQTGHLIAKLFLNSLSFYPIFALKISRTDCKKNSLSLRCKNLTIIMYFCKKRIYEKLFEKLFIHNGIAYGFCHTFHESETIHRPGGVAMEGG